MQRIKWLLAGVVGGAIGSAVWVGLELLTQKEMSWLSLLVGVLTGLAVRCASAPGTRGYLSGATAAVVTLAAIVLSTLGLSAILTSQNQSPSASAREIGAQTTTETNSEESTSGDEQPEEADVDVSAEKQEGARPKIQPRVGLGQSYKLRSSFPVTKLILFGCAGLLAYFVGKEESNRAAPEKTEEAPAT